MFDIGFIEILIISMVALIVIGPERLPQVARTVGHLIGRARRYVSGVKMDIENELKMEELKNLRASMQETAQSIKDSVQQETEQLKSMTGIKSSTTNSSPTPTESNTETEPQIQSASSTKPASQQHPSESDEAKHDTLDKENK